MLQGQLIHGLLQSDLEWQQETQGFIECNCYCHVTMIDQAIGWSATCRPATCRATGKLGQGKGSICQFCQFEVIMASASLIHVFHRSPVGGYDGCDAVKTFCATGALWREGWCILPCPHLWHG